MVIGFSLSCSWALSAVGSAFASHDAMRKVVGSIPTESIFSLPHPAFTPFLCLLICCRTQTDFSTINWAYLRGQKPTIYSTGM
ncbi:hypothetical protein B0H12DRAFT_1120177 [Mycena haematopus]|nr:hypothetical protein B0H12DRAFT_1120177 [Mycena haematopus]